MFCSSSDLSEVSELDFYSVGSHDSESSSDSEITSYNSADETMYVPSIIVSPMLAPRQRNDCRHSNVVTTTATSSSSIQSCPTTEDVISSQIFEGWDSSIQSDDIKLRFNECVKFFSGLSNNNRTILSSTNRFSTTSVTKCKSNQPRMINKCIGTLSKIVVDSGVQTESLDKDNSSPVCFFGMVKNDGDSCNAVSATATSVLSIPDDSSHRNISFKSSVESADFRAAAIKATTSAVSLALSSLGRQYSGLQEQVLINTTTIISPFVWNKAINESLPSPKINTPQITHISDNSTSSSTTDDSLPDTSKVFVATPFTITAIMIEESQPLPPVPSSSLCQLNGSNIDASSPAQISYSVNERNVSYSKILQSTFFRTSTPILGEACRRKSISNMNFFPSSSFVKSKSFRGLRENIMRGTGASKSLDHGQRSTLIRGMEQKDRHVFLSLYNLTCPKATGLDSVNPANLFFTQAKSYASLRETDIDSLEEKTRKIYRETNLDSRTPQSRSLTDVRKNANDNRLAICSDIDEDILNKYPSSTSLSLSTNLLYVRLRHCAESPAQIRVARSVTKLNVPDWLHPEDFAVYDSPTPSQTQDYISIPSSSRRLCGSLRYPPTLTPPKRDVHERKCSYFKLPSAKYHSTEHKLKPITVSKARQALELSKTPVKSAEISMTALSQEFIAHFPNRCEELKATSNRLTHSNQRCSRARCTKEVDSVRSDQIQCEQCIALYCSTKCRREDRKSHSHQCKINSTREWLSCLLDGLSEAQISLLRRIAELGRQREGVGVVFWEVDFGREFQLPRFVAAEECQGLHVTERLKELNGTDAFLLVISSPESKVVLSRSYKKKTPEENRRGLSPNWLQRSSKLSREEREKLFNSIVSLLDTFNINIQERSPATYFKLVEYVMSGCWFMRQTIITSDPKSGSPIKLALEPDQLPFQIKD